MKRNFVTLITLGNLILGFNAVVLASQQKYAWACLLVLWAAVLDGFDGPLARKFKVAGDFGAQMDSLADLITFVMAPAIIFYNIFRTKVPFPWIDIITSIYFIFGTLRLARFNTNPKDHYFFQGLSTTAAACIFSVYYLIMSENLLLIPVFTCIGTLMISNYKFPKIYLFLKHPRYSNFCLTVVGILYLIEGWKKTVLLICLFYIISGILPKTFKKYIPQQV